MGNKMKKMLCFIIAVSVMLGLYPKANADMVYNLQQSMTLG